MFATEFWIVFVLFTTYPNFQEQLAGAKVQQQGYVVDKEFNGIVLEGGYTRPHMSHDTCLRLKEDLYQTLLPDIKRHRVSIDFIDCIQQHEEI